jgi:hypothetical protein
MRNAARQTCAIYKLKSCNLIYEVACNLIYEVAISKHKSQRAILPVRLALFTSKSEAKPTPRVLYKL